MTDSTEQIKLNECLRSWYHVVQHMARRGRPPRGITNDSYVRLHRDLMRLVQESGGENLSPLDRLRQKLHHSVRPWVNLDSLAHCDKRILRMLEREVRLVCNQLMPRPLLRLKSLLAVVAILVVVLITYLFNGGHEQVAGVAGAIDALWQRIDGVRAQLWLGAVQSTTNQRLIVLAGLTVLAGMFFLRTPKRS